MTFQDLKERAVRKLYAKANAAEDPELRRTMLAMIRLDLKSQHTVDPLTSKEYKKAK